VVWGKSADNIVWGNAEGFDNIVWGNSADNIVWGNSGDDNIVWGNSAGDGDYGDDTAEYESFDATVWEALFDAPLFTGQEGGLQ
jgi:hypothetical protein